MHSKCSSHANIKKNSSLKKKLCFFFCRSPILENSMDTVLLVVGKDIANISFRMGLSEIYKLSLGSKYIFFPPLENVRFSKRVHRPNTGGRYCPGDECVYVCVCVSLLSVY